MLPWKTVKYYIWWVCVCSLNYSACNAHAPYCLMWPAPLCNIFPHFLINGTIFPPKKLLSPKCVFSFRLQFSPQIFLILWRTVWDMMKNIYWSSCTVPFVLVRYILKTEFSRKIFEKNSNIKFHENSSSKGRVVPCSRKGRQTDRHKRRD